MFSKILVANRGEIAVRIIRACKEMGIATVAVYSQADADLLHVALADESICIGRAASSESYLCADRIISAALVTGAQAVHPGYGFMSENAEFARMCEKHGLVFIGPQPETMELLSDKERTKRLMQEAGVPVIPGSRVIKDQETALAAAEEIGYPVLLKARSGGGGRGIRQVDHAGEMEHAFSVASNESRTAFGDDAVYMEKFIHPAKHIEVQILADEEGNTVCLGERDCSIQKRNQKLIEETPSPVVSAEQRDFLADVCIKAAKAVKYVNAGTLEFLMDQNGEFHFMEMNIRLQVEHPVTEQLTNIDIVKWQIRIAAGVLLDFKQEEIPFIGTSIECRINATASGKVEFLHIPGGPFVRFDTFLFTGMVVPPHYDALIGKLVVFAFTRGEAIRKMRAALCELVIEGVPNNIEEQIEILASPEFQDGSYNLDFFRNEVK
ncbi:acetyl-CoA carboxylase biotin carboxylase subunit [Parasporobacterium paucivorans]|uniref:biotin carboxylase n=1 Tax=Parasporobacterium paucivorans DSM 15970 TaxID=1122934 RepID=A0A1M6KCN1_9FIRM|nr:acetyl-CoA carboxylase biotin carboxylase subunit [Parasporobacterium paucivorans]SHJ56664.1 acetyl-CoA carboxylase, biotin carboxylase subunit [Parasporobacterium paucivorans DSM 15970]